MGSIETQVRHYLQQPKKTGSNSVLLYDDQGIEAQSRVPNQSLPGAGS